MKAGDKDSRFVTRVMPWLVMLLVVVAVIMAAVRLVINPWFVEFEYRTPDFPTDPYGFTSQDRLKYSKIAIDYLLNSAGISFLGDLRFPAGEQTPAQTCATMTDCTHLYNDRELKHMLDVKNVIQAALRIWYASLGALVLLGVWAWRGKWMDSFKRGLSLGGWMTIAVLFIVILFVLFGFDTFFVLFHDVFFQPGTWMFLYSDTLIRLFPERFWRDTFMVVGGIAVVISLLLALGFRMKEKKAV